MVWCGFLHRTAGSLAAAAAALVCLLAAGPAAAASVDNVTYQGGPVAHSMTGVLVDWGAGVPSTYTDETNGVPGLIKYLASQSGSPSDINGVVAQYMDSSGHNAANSISYGQQFQIAPSTNSTTISNSQVGSELSSQIQAGHLPRPAASGLQTMYLVQFPPGDVVCLDSSSCSANAPDPATAMYCAWHSSTTLSDGTHVLFAVLPDNTSGPMSSECGNASSLLADHTATISHEWSETISDPLGNAWWVNNSASADNGSEIGDTCNMVMTTEGGWTVQDEWSNRESNCQGGEPSYNAPTASFVSPAAAVPTQLVSFDASSSSDPGADSTAIAGTGYSIASGLARYSWNWGDGTTSVTSGPAATHAYTALGNYQVSLTVTDNLGFSSTVTHSLAVTSDGTATPSASTGTAANISDTGATLQGTVNPESQTVQYRFVYGASPDALSQSTTPAAGPIGHDPTPVSATVSGLSPSSTYYYRLDVVAGQTTYAGAVQSFTTNAAPPVAQTPSVATGDALQVSAHGALASGTVNPGGPQAVSYHFSYGTSSSRLTATTPQAAAAGTTSVPVSANLSGLSNHTTYYFRLDVTLGSQRYLGTVKSFTTRNPAPGAGTGAASKVTSSAATVTGAVQPSGLPTSYHIEFGTSTAYGHSTPAVSAGSGGSSVPVSVTISGLRAGTAYHYRLVATNAGGTSVGADAVLHTAGRLRGAPRFSFQVRSPMALRAALRGHLRVRFHCSRSCSAHFAVSAASASAQVTRFAPVAVTLGRGSGRARSRGRGDAALRFSPAVRARLRRLRAIDLVVYGYASARGSARTAPQAERLVLR